jgi:hypothetical protein
LEHFFKHAGTMVIAFLLELRNHFFLILQALPMQISGVLPLNFRL